MILSGPGFRNADVDSWRSLPLPYPVHLAGADRFACVVNWVSGPHQSMNFCQEALKVFTHLRTWQFSLLWLHKTNLPFSHRIIPF
jgi:hypothetical protein